jgi:hypothetical protein
MRPLGCAETSDINHGATYKKRGKEVKHCGIPENSQQINFLLSERCKMHNCTENRRKVGVGIKMRCSKNTGLVINCNPQSVETIFRGLGM